MYSRLQVQNFRGFSNVAIENLRSVNLVTGFNNVGKTALLEAIFLCGSNSPESVIKIRAFRGYESIQITTARWLESTWTSMFHRNNIEEDIKIVGDYSDPIGTRSVGISLQLDPKDLEKIGYEPSSRPSEIVTETTVISTAETSQILKFNYSEGQMEKTLYLVFGKDGLRSVPLPSTSSFETVFQMSRGRVSLEEDARRFGNIDKRGKQEILLDALRILEPRLKRLSMIYEAGPMLHGELDYGRLLPLADMGEGMVRLTSILNAIAIAPNGVVLIDEIESGIHYSIMPMVWSAIAQVAKEFNTQIFATTHSRECVVAAHEAFSSGAHYDLGLYRLYRNSQGEIAVADYDQENIEYAVEAGLEVR